MINPLHLRTFVTLIESKHFTRTADLLHMTQPGVSQHIQKLEMHLGSELIYRFGKRFEITEAGEMLYLFAKQQFQAEEQLLASLKKEQPTQGKINLACSGSMAMNIYPELLEMQKSFPELELCIEAAPNQAIIGQIKTNQIDVGLVTQLVNDAELEQTLLGYDELCLVVPKGAHSGWGELMELGFINHPDGHHYATQLLEANYATNFQGMKRVKQSGYINQLSQILLPVSQGLGFTVLPNSALTAFSYPEKIQKLILKERAQEPVYRTQKKYRTLPIRYKLLNDLLSRYFSDLS